MKSGDLIGIAPGVYATASEFRRRPLSLEVLANMIFGPSYLSLEHVLAKEGLIPEATRAITSATPTRNKDFDTPLGRFSYRYLPPSVFGFGWTRADLDDGSGYFVATPEKALLDWLYRSGAVRSIKVLEERLFEDLRLDSDALMTLNRDRLTAYARAMPGETFRVHFMKLLGRAYA
ncbi:MAG: type IV toxin-antitoxin system AbiEi family antitoxin domain-containing protein [Rectinemataceae bacterium]